MRHVGKVRIVFDSLAFISVIKGLVFDVAILCFWQVKLNLLVISQEFTEEIAIDLTQSTVDINISVDIG